MEATTKQNCGSNIFHGYILPPGDVYVRQRIE
jgi:hypothetical protein